MTFLAPGSSIPGPETNGFCGDSADNDGDGVVNDGCPSVGYDLESNRCDNVVNDDSFDDSTYNDGCPVAGASPESGTQCTNSVNDDPVDDTKVNDGCFPGGIGVAQAETNAWCDGSTNEDPRDDAAGGGQKVNDGCPAVGAAESAGPACDDTVDSDGDTKVNDGCATFGGVEAELNECQNALDDDVDGLVNDGCPEPALSSPPVGAVAGSLRADPFSAGLANTVCSPQAVITAGMFNSTTQNALWNEWGMGDAHPYGAMGPFRDDYNGNSLPTHVDRYPEFLNQMFDPDRVGDLNGDGDHFDVGANGVAENPGASPLDWYGTVEPLRPVARYSASTIVNSQALLYQLVVFAPGAFGAYQRPHPFSDFASSALGFPAVFVLQAPTANPIPEPITDICSPSTLKIILWGVTRDNPCTGSSCNTGNDRCINGEWGAPACPLTDPPAGACGTPSTHEGNCVRYANPSTAGTHYFGVFQQSQRDADGDGYENGLDTCPMSVNAENPRTGAGPDGDMLDSACDPFPAGNNTNQDGDIHTSGGNWLNAQDNCPLISNPDNKESERDQPHSAAAPRGGSRLDAMGDACEPAETACGAAVDDDGDTLVNDGCAAVGGAAAEGTCSYSTSTEVDNDLDGYPNDGCPQSGATSEAGADCEDFVNDDAADDSLVNDGCPAQGGPERGCLNSVDDDADGSINDGCPSSANVANGHFHTVFQTFPKCIGSVDSDGDGYCNETEASLGSSLGAVLGSSTPEHYSLVQPFPLSYAGSGVRPIGPESGAECAAGNSADNDDDGVINDGCPAVAAVEALSGCNDNVDEDGDGLVNDGCPAQGSDSEADQCEGGVASPVNNDPLDDSRYNDGCPQVGSGPESGADCTDTDNDDVADDGATPRVNDGCPVVGAPQAETGTQCDDETDDDPRDDAAAGAVKVNDGCPAVDAAETACDEAGVGSDDDGDTKVNDGCYPSYGGAESEGQRCLNATDDDGDDVVNDGCPTNGLSEIAFVCLNEVDDDSDGYANDGCGAEAAQEPRNVCNDRIDNDGDTRVDLEELDGDDTDNKPDCMPPDTIFTSGTDSDGDGSKDQVEAYLGTDSLGRCEKGLSANGATPSFDWPIDLRGETSFSADKVNVSDLGTFTSGIRKFNTRPGDLAFDRRWDLRPGTTFGSGWINVADLAVISTGNPVPMYGVRAFQFFSVCSAHPVYAD